MEGEHRRQGGGVGDFGDGRAGAVQSSLEDMSIAVENARLSLQRAQDALENYTITAPIWTGRSPSAPQ